VSIYFGNGTGGYGGGGVRVLAVQKAGDAKTCRVARSGGVGFLCGMQCIPKSRRDTDTMEI
jgi:hypothetical protein